MMPQSWRSRCWQLGLVGSLAVGGLIASGDCALAQITPDSTLGAESSAVIPTNIKGLPSDQINGGAIRGANLFHSFQKFNISEGRGAYFTNPDAIQNILSRVTGNDPSNILGKLGVLGDANLFLINPNGFIFGPNASLDVGGSFVASTASSLNFADGTEFSATNPQTKPLLTINVPLGLQFGAGATGIQVQGSGLAVQPGKTLALVGGDVTLSGGDLAASGGQNLAALEGRIELGSVAANSLVNLTATDFGWALRYNGVHNFQDILLSQGVFVDASGEGGGDIQVQGRRVTLTDGSQIVTYTSGAGNAGNLTVRASDSVELIGESANGWRSALEVRSYSGATGGTLTLETGRLIVRDRAQIGVTTFSSGSAGKLTVKASDSVELIGRPGDGQQGTGLYTSVQPGATGPGGNLILETGQLIVRNGQIGAGTYSEGRAGSLTIRAYDLVELSAPLEVEPFVIGLFTAVEPGATGDGGNLTLETGRLIVRDGAVVSSATRPGTKGAAGTLTVRASDSVELIGRPADGQPPTGLSSSTEGAGDAQNLRIETGQLTVRDRATVTVSSTSSGKAGELQLTARGILLNNQAAISSDTTAGQGNIILRSGDLVLHRGSNITTNATGTATGGNITIDTDILAALENSDISANAQESFGGQVIIDAQGIFGTQFRNQQTKESDITASSSLGPLFSGTVEINTPDVDPSQGLATLPVELVEASGLIATGCAAVAENKFIVTGRGGIPPTPSDPLSSDTVWSDLRYRTQLALTRSSSEEATNPTNSAPTHIVEAQGWMINDNGEVVLTATAPTLTPHNPWIPSATCHTPQASS